MHVEDNIDGVINYLWSLLSSYLFIITTQCYFIIYVIQYHSLKYNYCKIKSFHAIVFM